MGRRYAVSQLPEDQLDFVIKAILNGWTDREISQGFEKEFHEKLSKSSIARWREAAGDELAKQYRFARVQAQQLKEDLGEKKSTNLELIFGNIEDRLLVTAREIIAKDPVKLLQLRMDEENRRLKEREVKVKEGQLDLEKAKAKAVDPAAMPNQVLEYLLEFAGDNTAWLKLVRVDAEKLEAFLAEKFS